METTNNNNSYTQHSKYSDGVEIGYLGSRPVILADGHGAARCTDGEGILLDGEWLAIVVDGKWVVSHKSYWGSLGAPQYDDTEYSADGELAAITGLDVGWVQ